MSVQAEAIAVQALQEYLLLALPAKVAAVNALRTPILKTAYAGPFVIPDTSGGGPEAYSILTLAADRASAGVDCQLTAGTRTAAAIAGEINTQLVGYHLGIVASADSDGRLVLTGAAPSEGVHGCVVAKAASWLGVFGWDIGGEHSIVEALTAPLRKGICDGWPVTPPDMGRTMWLIIGDRMGQPVAPDNRRDETLVTMDVTVWVPDRTGTGHRNRERVSAAVRCLREVLLTPTGRQLGRGATGDVVFSAITRCQIPAKPFALGDAKAPQALFDAAVLTLAVRVFEVPS